jgi:hypothetical protein
MGPVCLTTAALAVAGVILTGGLTTPVVRKLRTGVGANRINPTTGIKGDQYGSPKSRVTR